jgi:phage tail sheath protein FI/enoyl-CoA hydratase/carnithine racemase
MNDRVVIHLDNEGVADVRLNRADKMNALDSAMIEGILAAQDQLRAEPRLRAVVLHGEGRAFCAGLDLSRFRSMAAEETGRGYTLADRTHGIANAPQQTAWGWRDLPVPVIAAVHGVAFGGGLQIALGADIRCVTSDVKLSVMEIKWGLVPDMAGIALLRELVRGDVARELTYSGRIINGDEAVRLGLATWAGSDPLAQARELARSIARRSPDAIRAAKRLLNRSADADAAALLVTESREQERLMGSPNQIEAVRAEMEQRPPEFSAPGVYVEEISFRAHSIEGVPTSTAAFIGPTHTTPPATDSAAREPLRSFLEFEQQYGGLDDLQTAQGSGCNYVAHAARVFFDNGGQRLYIGQVSADALAEEYAAALQALPESAGISVIAAPGYSARAAAAEIQQALIEHVSQPERFRFAVFDAPPAATIDEVLAARSSIDSSYAAMYYPWVTTQNSVQLPPSGFVCGIYARTDNARGVWKAPANETVTGAVDLQTAIDTHGQERLSAQGINSIRSFPARGILLWGARTASQDPLWKYVNVRRYFIYLEQSIHDGLQWVVFEPNGEPLWKAVRQTITNFLLNNWRSGALMGTKPEEAFFVRCDSSTMTQNDIDNGRLIVEIGVAPVRPAEFVIIRIGLWTASRCATC